MMNLKNLYRRFRVWQRKPFDYKNESKGKTRCANCGTMCDDNYCPRCGQSSGIGRITWKSVEQSIMVVWGMESRSLPNSILQLFFRPGRFISDYISGKRQISYPPVNMLVIVAILSYFVDLIAPEKINNLEDGLEVISSFRKWSKDNLAWATLLTNSLLILPTWFVYRFSPRHNRHTLPEGFFIQVFISTQMLIIGYFAQFFNPIFNFLNLIYYFIIYKQLFGYGFWGNLWRLFLCLYEGFFIEIIVCGVIMYHNKLNNFIYILLLILFIFLFIVVPTAIAYYIGRHQERKKKKALMPPPLPQEDAQN